MLRGTIDPKEPPVYEYVKVIGNFKSLNNGEFQEFAPNEMIFPGLCSSAMSALRQCLTVPRTVLKE